jgi:hypothetical protein
MSINLRNKFGAKPEFTPIFVNQVIRTISGSNRKLEISDVAEMLNQYDGEKFAEMIQFGQINGFWGIKDSSTIVLNSMEKYSEDSWNSLQFSEYIVNSMCTRKLDEPENWNTFAALISWSYSLRITAKDKTKNRVLLVPDDWEEFESYGISTGLSRKDKNGNGIVINKEQWGIARKWMLAIGSFVQFHEFKMPSSNLLSHRLKNMMPNASNTLIPVREIVEKMRTVMPFLPGGSYGRIWSKYLESLNEGVGLSDYVDRDEENILSQQESISLLVLESAETIKLHDRNDAGDRFLLTAGPGREVRSVSHIEVLTETEAEVD